MLAHYNILVDLVRHKKNKNKKKTKKKQKKQTKITPVDWQKMSLELFLEYKIFQI